MPTRQELEFTLVIGLEPAGTANWHLKLNSAPKIFPEEIPLVFGGQVEYPKHLIGMDIGNIIQDLTDKLRFCIETEIKRKFDKEFVTNFAGEPILDEKEV